MGVGADFGDLALQLDAAWLVACQLKLFGDDGYDLSGMKTVLLRGNGLGKRGAGERIHVLAADAVFFGEVFSRLDHIDPGGGVFQGFPHIVFEADGSAEFEAGAVVERGNRVARHAFRAHDQSGLARAALNLLARLAKQLKARATNALRHQRGHFDGHSGIQPNVAGQEKLIEVAGGHVACDDRTDVGSRHTCVSQGGACGLDAQVGGGDVAQCATVIDHRGTQAAQQPYVVKRREKTAWGAACAHGGHVLYASKVKIGV